MILSGGEGYKTIDNNAAIGDIDVSKTVSELRDMGLLAERAARQYRSTFWRKPLDSNCFMVSARYFDGLMRFYVQNCLNTDLDKEFFCRVASDGCLSLYSRMYFTPPTEETCPITLMRLVIERQSSIVTGMV
jgi:hypothetical protein